MDQSGRFGFTAKRDALMYQLRKADVKDLIERRRTKFIEQNSKDVFSVENSQLKQTMQGFKENLDTGSMYTYGDTLTKIRQLVSVDQPALSCNTLVEVGLLPYILEFLKERFSHEHLILKEALWVIANLAGVSEDNTKLLLKNDLLDLYLQVIRSEQLEDILENISYTLANMLSFNDLKDTIRSHKAFTTLIAAIEKPTTHWNRSVEACRVYSWMYSNALFEPYPDIHLAFHLAHYMTAIFARYPDDKEIASESIWGLLKFLQAEPLSVERKKMLHERNIMPFVAMRMNAADLKVQRIALQVLELFSRECKNKEYLDSFLEEMNNIEGLYRALGSTYKCLRKCAIQILTHASICHPILRMRVTSPQLLDLLNRVVATDQDPEVKIEALSFLKFYVHHMDVTEAKDFLNYNEKIVDHLLLCFQNCEHMGLVRSALSLLDSLLEVGETFRDDFNGNNIITEKVIESENIRFFEELGVNGNNDIMTLQGIVISRYFHTTTN